MKSSFFLPPPASPMAGGGFLLSRGYSKCGFEIGCNGWSNSLFASSGLRSSTYYWNPGWGQLREREKFGLGNGDTCSLPYLGIDRLVPSP